MAKYIKGTISYIPVVDQINRKFTTVSNKSKAPTGVHLPVKEEPAIYMGGATRQSLRGGGMGPVSKNYMFFRENARTSIPSASELLNRQLFAQVVKAYPTLMENMQAVDIIYAMWNGTTPFEGKSAKADKNLRVNGVSAEGYTLKGWVLAVQHAGKKNDPQYNLTTWPQSYDA